MSNLKKSDRTRIEILDAAWDLIAERGAAVSLAEIAKAVGITRQAVYVHFGSRSGLLLALVRRADERFKIWQSFDSAIAENEPRIRLDAVLCAWLEFVPKIHPVAIDLVRLRAKDSAADAAWVDRMSDLHSFFLRVVSSLAGDNALSEQWEVETAADYMWAACSVQAWDLLVSDRGWHEEQAGRIIRRTIAATLLK